MQPEESFPCLRYNPLQIFYRSKTPAALYARQKWLHQDNTKTWKNDFHETVDVLFAGQCTNGSWNNSLVPTIRALFGLHLTVRQKDPKIERGLEWLLSEEVFSERYSRPANGPHRVSVRELHGLPFSGGSLNYLAKGAGLFLATIFGMENDPRVVRTYKTLRLLGEKREGRWCSWSCSSNILRALIVHPLYRDSSLTRMYVKRLGQLQRPYGHWPPQIPFYQTVNALGHLDFLQSDDLLRRSFMTLREKQNKDGTWGRTQREWNTFKVSFFWPFAGHYWIVDLGENYEYAVIGHPKRKYLWILSRSKEIEGEVYETILSRLRDKQYDTSRLIKTVQK